MPAPRIYTCLTMRSLFLGKGIRFVMGRFMTDDAMRQAIIEKHDLFKAGVIRRVDAPPEAIAEEVAAEVEEKGEEALEDFGIDLSSASKHRDDPPSATQLNSLKRDEMIDLALHWKIPGINPNMKRYEMFRVMKRFFMDLSRQ